MLLEKHNTGALRETHNTGVLEKHTILLLEKHTILVLLEKHNTGGLRDFEAYLEKIKLNSAFNGDYFVHSLAVRLGLERTVLHGCQ